jgi:hypothetical protein
LSGDEAAHPAVNEGSTSSTDRSNAESGRRRPLNAEEISTGDAGAGAASGVPPLGQRISERCGAPVRGLVWAQIVVA